MTEQAPAEDLAQLINRLKDTYGVDESEVARKIGVSPATVNAWVHRTRGTGRGPKPETLEKIPVAFPLFSRAEVFAAVGRKTPGPLSPDATARLLAYFEELTADQQRLFETQVRAVVESNRSSAE